MSLENPGFNPQATSDKFEKNAESGLLFREEEHLLKKEQDQELKNNLQDINEKLRKISQEFSKLSTEGDYFYDKEKLQEVSVSLQELKAEKQIIENKLDKLKERKEKFTLEIEGKKIEGEKYYFAYPEKVQEESGILGYERIKIPIKDLEGCSLYSVFSELSNNEYPSRCFNHIFSGYVREDSIKNEYFNEFKKSKFFLQKIFSRDSRNRLGAYSFYHPWDTLHRIQELIDKEDNVANRAIPEAAIRDYLEGKKDLQADNKWIFSELNCNIANFWLHFADITIDNSVNQHIPSICFGFSMNDNILEEYFKESLNIIKDIKNSWHLSTGFWGITSLNGPFSYIFNLLHFNKNIQKLYFETKDSVDKKVVERVVDEAFAKLESETSFPISESLLADFRKRGRDNDVDGIADFKSYLVHNIISNIEWRQKYPRVSMAHNLQEAQLPIFIGHAKMPQLSWGHAKYAHLVDEKNLNFLTFEHEDYLARE